MLLPIIKKAAPEWFITGAAFKLFQSIYQGSELLPHAFE